MRGKLARRSYGGRGERKEKLSTIESCLKAETASPSMGVLFLLRIESVCRTLRTMLLLVVSPPLQFYRFDLLAF
jgi:hypothetical protein